MAAYGGWLDEELGKYSPVSDELILAATERASLHDRDRHILHWRIGHHLGFAHSAWNTRQLRPRIEGMAEAGLLSKTQIRQRDFYALTAAGTRRLRRARRLGEVDPLPESPQHREWARARRIAEQALPQITAELSADIDTLHRLRFGPKDLQWLESAPIFDLAVTLRWNLWRLGAATYCLREWPPPSDDSPAESRPRWRECEQPHPCDAVEHFKESTSERFKKYPQAKEQGTL